jgi:hypothetical protein
MAEMNQGLKWLIATWHLKRENSSASAMMESAGLGLSMGGSCYILFFVLREITFRIGYPGREIQ